MTFRYRVWLTGTIGLVIWCGVLTSGLPGTDPGCRVSAEMAEPLASSESDVVIRQLKERLDQLEQDLEALKRSNVLPDLLPAESEPSSAALAPLRELAVSHLQTWRRTIALYESGRVGGEAEKEAKARTAFHMALARLAWAEHREEEARGHLQEAIAAAGQMVSAIQAAYDARAASLDEVLEAVELRAALKLTLLRAGGELEKSPEQSEPWQLPPGRMPKSY